MATACSWHVYNVCWLEPPDRLCVSCSYRRYIQAQGLLLTDDVLSWRVQMIFRLVREIKLSPSELRGVLEPSGHYISPHPLVAHLLVV